MKSQRGFTLGELVTVMAVGAIVSAAMVPVASQILNAHRLQAATRQLSFEVTRARMQAVGQNMFVRIRLLESGQYVRERSADGVSYTTDGMAVALPKGQSVRVGSNGTPTFNRQGLAASSTTFVVSGAAGQRTLSVSILGRVRVS